MFFRRWFCRLFFSCVCKWLRRRADEWQEVEMSQLSYSWSHVFSHRSYSCVSRWYMYYDGSRFFWRKEIFFLQWLTWMSHT
jgi:hypothetical protein